MVDLVRVEFAVRVQVGRSRVERGELDAVHGRALRFRRVGQVGEHERGAQHVRRVILPAEPLVVQARRHVGALHVEVVPHALAAQRPRVRRAFEIRRIAEEPCEDRADRGAESHLVDRVALACIVDAHLRGGGCAHHARSELPDAPQVLVHRGVAQFGVEWDVCV